MRKTAFLIFTFMPLLGLTQRKEYYQLQYKDTPNYTETNHFLTDSIWRFQQTVEYNVPNMWDEEIWTKLDIQIIDTTAFLQKRTLDLRDDSLIVKPYFKKTQTWHTDHDNTSITGQIQLLSMTHEGIWLKLNLKVTSLKSHNQFIYAGERMFYKFDRSAFAKKLADEMLSVDSMNTVALLYAGITSFSDKNPDLRTAIKYFEKMLPLSNGSEYRYASANWYIGRSYQILLQSEGLTYDEVSRMLDCFSTYLRLRPNADDAKKISSYVQHIKDIRPPEDVKKWINKPQ